MLYTLSPSIKVINGYKTGMIYDSFAGKLFEIDKITAGILLKANVFNSVCEIRNLFRKQLSCQKYKDSEIDIIISKLLNNNVFVKANQASLLPKFKLKIIPPENPSRSKIEITGKCNFRCKHCYALANADCPEIPKDKILLLITELNTLNVKKIQFTGGEPLLDSNIKEYISTALKYSMDTKVATNGSLLNDDLINFLVSNNIKVQISIYGLTHNIFAKLGIDKKHCTRVLQNAEKFAKLAPHLLLLTHTVTKDTLNEIQNFFDYAKSLGVKAILGRPFKIGRAVRNWNHLKVHASNPQVSQYFVEDIDSKNERVCFRCTPCRVDSIDIFSNGNVSTCVLMRKNNIVFGNIFKSTLSEIWNQPNRKYLSSIRVDNIPICRSCEYKYLCGGGCMAGAYSVIGRVDEPFPFCTQQKNIIQKYYMDTYAIKV